MEQSHPEQAKTGIDYLGIFRRSFDASDHAIDAGLAVPSDVIDHPNISYLSRFGLENAGSRLGWRTPGFFIGDANSLEDLVCHWNLRACNIPLWFVDAAHIARYAAIIPAWEAAMRGHVADRSEFERKVGVWTRSNSPADVVRPFNGMDLIVCPVSDATWNGLNVRAPDMSWKRVSALGVVSNADGNPRISFALNDKPFSGDAFFYTQHLVASLSFIGGLYRDERHTLQLPYIPELNEFFARAMISDYRKLRSERDGFGIVIDAADSDLALNALPVADLFEEIFRLAGLRTCLSNAGFILRQLLARLGGI